MEVNNKVNWTISGFREGGSGLVYTPTQSFAFKKLAVAAMMSQREPKTRITRVGRDFMFQIAKDTKQK